MFVGIKRLMKRRAVGQTVKTLFAVVLDDNESMVVAAGASKGKRSKRLEGLQGVEDCRTCFFQLRLRVVDAQGVVVQAGGILVFFIELGEIFFL